MKKPQLSIIVISFNTKEITKKCLDSIINSLLKSSVAYEIIVIDNGSTDGSFEFLKKHYLSYSNIRIIGNTKNLGYGKANNLGVKHSKGEYFLFLNSDVIVLDNAIETLFDYFKKQKSFNFVGGKLLNKDKSPQGSCRPAYSLPMIFVHFFLQGDYLGITSFSPTKIRKVDWISGACIICQKRDFYKVGGYDEKIFMYMEETEFFHRAMKKGLIIGFYPYVKFIHIGGSSTGGINSNFSKMQVLLYIYKGYLYFYKKHFTKRQLSILKFLLKLRALISTFIGRAVRNKELVEANKKAYRIVSSE